MATANSIARYTFTEGTGTVVNDSVGSNHLSLNFNGAGSWLTTAGRKGISSTFPMATGTTTTAMTANLVDISTNGNIGSSLKDATGMSVVMMIDPAALTATPYGSYLFRLGPDSHVYGDIEITHGDGIALNWGRAGDGGAEVEFQNYSLVAETNVPFVVTMVIDTTQALIADRVRVWYNQTEIPQTISQTDVIHNVFLGSVDGTDRSLSWFNGNNLTSNFWKNVEGDLYYGEIFTGQLTPAQVVSYATNILANADVDGGLAAGGARFSGLLQAWDTNTAYANGANLKMFASETYGAAAVNASAHLFTTDADGAYSTVITECTPGALYWIQKESDDGTIASLQLQLAKPV